MTMGAGIGSAITGIGQTVISAQAAEDDPGRRAIQNAMDLLRRVQDPNFDWRQISAPQLQFISAIAPEVYEAVVPPEVKTAAESEMRAPQARAVAALEQVGREGMPLADKLAASEATDAIAREGQRAQGAISRELAARGRMGGGMELQARMMGDQAMAGYMGNVGRSLAQDAIRRRLEGVQSAGALSTAARGQDLERNRRNAEMINNFNRYVSALQTDAARYGADVRNREAERQAGERQRVADANVMARYATDTQNLNRQNSMAQSLADFQLRRAGGQGSFARDMADSLRASEAARNQNRSGIMGGIGQFAGGAIDAWNANRGGQSTPDAKKPPPTVAPTAAEEYRYDWYDDEPERVRESRGLYESYFG